MPPSRPKAYLKAQTQINDIFPRHTKKRLLYLLTRLHIFFTLHLSSEGPHRLATNIWSGATSVAHGRDAAYHPAYPPVRLDLEYLMQPLQMLINDWELYRSA